MNNVTKAERQRRIEWAKAALLAAGFTVESRATGMIVAAIMAEFGITDYRTAQRIETRAAMILRGDLVVAPRVGRPQRNKKLVDGQSVSLTVNGVPGSYITRMTPAGVELWTKK